MRRDRPTTPSRRNICRRELPCLRRAKSTADFINKLTIVEEEADESAYWIELLIDAGAMKPARLADLLKEADELTAIVVATARSARRKK